MDGSCRCDQSVAVAGDTCSAEDKLKFVSNMMEVFNPKARQQIAATGR
jgi:hypothetical protein